MHAVRKSIFSTTVKTGNGAPQPPQIYSQEATYSLTADRQKPVLFFGEGVETVGRSIWDETVAQTCWNAVKDVPKGL